jgi:NAD(P)-dependent dehydrogenase (short-subunit alcohol dehydrogenase family)
MPKKFAGKVAVVTGGSTGMGLATAKRFVQEGMDHVFITGRRKDALDAAVAEIGKSVTAVQGDVASLSDLDRLYDAVKKHHRPIDIIFANAGVAKLPPFDEGRRVDHPEWIDCGHQRFSRHECVQRYEGGGSFVCPDLDQ